MYSSVVANGIQFPDCSSESPKLNHFDLESESDFPRLLTRNVSKDQNSPYVQTVAAPVQSSIRSNSSSRLVLKKQAAAAKKQIVFVNKFSHSKNCIPQKLKSSTSSTSKLQSVRSKCSITEQRNHLCIDWHEPLAKVRVNNRGQYSLCAFDGLDGYCHYNYFQALSQNINEPSLHKSELSSDNVSTSTVTSKFTYNVKVSGKTFSFQSLSSKIDTNFLRKHCVKEVMYQNANIT